MNSAVNSVTSFIDPCKEIELPEIPKASLASAAKSAGQQIDGHSWTWTVPAAEGNDQQLGKKYIWSGAASNTGYVFDAFGTNTETNTASYVVKKQPFTDYEFLND